MNTSRAGRSGLILIFSALPLLFLVEGCETPQGTAAAGHIFDANAALASSLQEAVAWKAMGSIASTSAQMEHEKQVAEAGSSQVTINVNRVSESSTSGLSEGEHTIAGRHYLGQYRNGKMEGRGTYTWPDGRKYVGEWKDDNRDGQGTMYYADGKVESGIWRDDKLETPHAVTSVASRPETTDQTQTPVIAPAQNAVSLVKTGLITITAADDTAEVLVDGKFKGNTPAKLKLTEGMHVIEVRKSGFKDYKREIEVTDGAEQSVKAILEEL